MLSASVVTGTKHVLFGGIDRAPATRMSRLFSLSVLCDTSLRQLLLLVLWFSRLCLYLRSRLASI